jgi:peptide deformylase
MGEPLLFQDALPVLDFSDPAIKELLVDMFDTMEAAGGVGLAAPQIGVSLQVVIFGFGKSARYPTAEAVPRTILINPQIFPVGDEETLGWEGCLSLPGLRGEVPRVENIRYTGFDENGLPIDRTVSGFHARVVQHECDHLNGRLFPSRIRDFKRFGFTEVLFPDLGKPTIKKAFSFDSTVAGIDIGGETKGFHLVILQGPQVICNLNTKRPDELLNACRIHNVVAVGIDSPCRWGCQDGARLAERMLAQERISSFATPTRKRALENTSGFYGWIFNGEAVYQELEASYQLLKDEEYRKEHGKVCFETFPHAITCAFLGKDTASAKLKRAQRRMILEDHGIDTTLLKSVDAIDAGLCALTAAYIASGKSKSYGDAVTGYIFVPAN